MVAGVNGANGARAARGAGTRVKHAPVNATAPPLKMVGQNAQVIGYRRRFVTIKPAEVLIHEYLSSLPSTFFMPKY